MTNDEIPMTKQMPGESKVMDIPALGMYFFLAGEAMFFVGLLGSFVVLESAGGQHQVFVNPSDALQPWYGIIGAIMLVVSSVAIVRDWFPGKCIAAVAAISFLTFEIDQWKILLANQDGPWSNNFFACYFLFTMVHFLHLIVGIVVLLWFLIRPTPGPEVLQRRGRIPAPLQMYWHFFNATGVLGFFVLYFVR